MILIKAENVVDQGKQFELHSKIGSSCREEREGTKTYSHYNGR